MIRLRGCSIARWLGLLVGVGSLVALIIYIVNSNLDYYNNLSAMIVTLTVLSMLCGCALFLFGDKISKSSIASTVTGLVMVVLLAVCIISSISDRAMSFAYIWFSDLDKGNADAVYALNQYIVCLVFYLICLVAAVVIGFFDLNKEKPHS